MKTGIHPKYNTPITISCACGNSFKSSSTLGDINVEICSACHPFWTGQDKLLDSTGRVDRFKKRATKTETKKAK